MLPAGGHCDCFMLPVIASWRLFSRPGRSNWKQGALRETRQIVPQRNTISLRFCTCTKTLSVELYATF